MKIRITRLRLIAASLTLCGAAATVAIAGTASASPAAAGHQARPAVATTPMATVPVLITCNQHGVVRPGSYVFACADGNAYLNGLHWARWAGTDAFANGSYVFNDCTPYCAAGHFHSLSALVVLWRPEPWPGHSGREYFSEATVILNGNRSYTAGGHVHHLPVTITIPLFTSGG
jgi:hypothetical protein